MLVETTLSRDYQPQWSILDALREIISNALDAEARFQNPKGIAEIRFSKGVLTACTLDVRLPMSVLLMGESEARHEETSIGNFGEGLPMALLVLAREGRSVVIYNGMEKWEPTCVKSDTFGKEVLAINTRRMLKERVDFEINISILPSEWAEAQRLFLRLDPSFDLTESYGRRLKVLTGERFVGRIYNRGVFVMSRPGLLFGYNLDTKLGRDRTMIRDYDLDDAIESVWKEVQVHEREGLEAFVERTLDKPQSYEGRLNFSSGTLSSELTQAFKKKLVLDSGMVRVSSEDEAVKVRARGLRPIIIPHMAAASERLRSAWEVYDLPLETSEITNTETLAWIHKLQIMAKAIWGLEFKVKGGVFEYESQACCWQDDDTLIIPKALLSDPYEGAAAVAHALDKRGNRAGHMLARLLGYTKKEA